MESIIREKILLHLIRNKVLSDCQHGFVPGRNCLTQLLLCLDDWSKMIGEGEPFLKAFDYVAHQRLFMKIRVLGDTRGCSDLGYVIPLWKNSSRNGRWLLQSW